MQSPKGIFSSCEWIILKVKVKGWVIYYTIIVNSGFMFNPYNSLLRLNVFGNGVHLHVRVKYTTYASYIYIYI